jgi:prephenate dehydrogenase
LPAPPKLVVLGVGLIGGSFALALKQRGVVGEVVGIGRSRANLDDAIAAGIVDRAVTRDGPWVRELGDADVVVLATPVGEFPALFEAIAGALSPKAVLTDGGSTKQDVVAAARATLGAALPRFVPAHPIAGTEQSGARSAFATLFDARRVVLTPLPETDADALARVRALWEACGAEIVSLEPAVHDRVLAAVSHLPHFLAAAYVADLAVRSDARDLFAMAGSGFRDFTRIAASSPPMWRDIGLANRDALRAEIAAYRGALDVLDAAFRDGDGRALLALLDAAAQARRAWAEQSALAGA